MSGIPRWPAEQRFLAEGQEEALRARCEPGFVECCRRLRIDTDLRPYLGAFYLPLGSWLERRRRRQGAALVVGLCGAQGSGKSTVAALLQAVMTDAFGCRIARFSIDDIYRTREERQRLARDVHPLFATRGVPLTHDVELGIETLDRLKAQGSGESTAIPAFDKAVDTRRPRAEWPDATGPIDVILFEGWCVGARPQLESELAEPVNALERDEDPEGIWRRASNEALAGDYRRLFARLDVLLLLQVDGMDRVFEWRRLQEHKLVAHSRESGGAREGLAIMSDAEVDRFVMHYERLTRHILREMPARADIVFPIDDTHNPAAVRINRPL